jgi:hypothetical protein
LCSHTRKKKCGRVSKCNFIFYCFLNCVSRRFYSVRKHINKSLYFGEVWYLTPLHYPKWVATVSLPPPHTVYLFQV